MGATCSMHGIDVYTTLVRKPEGKRPFGRFRRRWEENIEIYLREIR